MALLQIRCVLWKNYLLKRRRFVSTMVEVVLPLFLFLLLVWIRARHPPINVPPSLSMCMHMFYGHAYMCMFNLTHT